LPKPPTALFQYEKDIEARGKKQESFAIRRESHVLFRGNNGMGVLGVLGVLGLMDAAPKWLAPFLGGPRRPKFAIRHSPFAIPV